MVHQIQINCHHQYPGLNPTEHLKGELKNIEHKRRARTGRPCTIRKKNPFSFMLQALERVKKNVFILGKGMPKALTSGLPASLRLMFMLEITFVSIFSSFLNSVRLVARFYQNIWGKIKIQTTKTRIYFKTLYQIYQCT